MPSRVLLINPKYPQNVAAAVRAVVVFDAQRLHWTGRRINLKALTRIPRELRKYTHLPTGEVPETERGMGGILDGGYTPVCVEIMPGSESLTYFEHPEKAVYVFGPEDGSVPSRYAAMCHRFVHVPATYCLNLAMCVSVVLYDRQLKRELAGLDPIVPIEERLKR